MRGAHHRSDAVVAGSMRWPAWWQHSAGPPTWRCTATVQAQGPLDEPTSHLVSMATAAAVGSEGAVHSHARRALAAGGSADQIRLAVLLLVTTIGLPRAAAAMVWVDDIVDGPRGAAAGRH